MQNASTIPLVTIGTMKSSFLLLAFFLFSLLAKSQLMDSLYKETYAFSFGEGVRVRNAPSLTAPVVGKLRMGDEVLVLRSNVDDYDTWTKINGSENPWLEVLGPDGLKGYVWAGLMAYASLSAPLPGEAEPSLLLLLGLRSEEGTSGWALRVVKDGKLLREIPLEESITSSIPTWLTVDDDMLGMEWVNAEGFDPPLTMLSITQGICACGCYQDDSYYIWAEDRLEKAFELHASSNGEYEGSTYGDWQMSFSKPGVDPPNEIIIDIVEGEYVRDGEAEESVRQLVFRWDGIHLLEVGK